MGVIADLMVQVGAEISDFTSGMEKVEDRVDSLGSRVSKGMSSAGSSLTNLGGRLTALGAPFAALFAVGTSAAVESRKQIGQLDAVLKSTEASMTTTAATAGHWATVTQASGANVAEWKDQLESAQSSLSALQAKQAAGIPLTQSQQDRIHALQTEVAGYTNALSASTTTSKVWVAGQAATTSISHMTRQAYLDLATGLQKVTNFSDEAVLGSENLMLTFTHIGKDIFPDATKAALDMSTAMGEDLKSATIQIGKAINDPIKGYTALQRVGVTFTDSQKKQIETLQKSGDLMGAQRIILNELNTEFGGSAVAAVAADGGMTQFQNRLDDVMEKLGANFIPILSSVTGGLGDMLDRFDALDPSVQTAIADVIAVGAGLATVGPVIAAVGIGLSAAAPIVGAFATALALIASPLGLVVAGLALLAAGATGVIDFSPIINSIESGLIGALNDLKNLTGFDAVGIAQSVKDKITGAFDTLFATPVIAQRQRAQLSDDDLMRGTGLANAVKGQSLFQSMVSGITDGFQNLDFSEVTPIMQTHFTDILGAIVSVIGIVFGGPVSVGLGIASLVKTAIDNDFLGLGTLLKSSGISDSVTTALNDLKNGIQTIATNVFSGGGASPLGDGIHKLMGGANVNAGGWDPLAVLKSDLQRGAEGLKTVLDDAKNNLQPGMDALAGGPDGKSGIPGFLASFKDTDTSGLLRIATGIGGAVGALLAPLIDFGTKLIGDVLTNFSDALPKIGSFISDLISAISGLGKGDFGEMASKLGQAALDLGQAALDLLGINIPIPSFDDAIKGWQTGLDAIKGVVNNVGADLKKGFDAIVGWISNFVIDVQLGALRVQLTATQALALVGVQGQAEFAISLQSQIDGLEKAQANLNSATGSAVPVLPTGNQAAVGFAPGAASGAKVMMTGAVLAHTGERILNPKETRAYENGGSPVSSGNTFNITTNDADQLLFELKRQGIDLRAMAKD